MSGYGRKRAIVIAYIALLIWWFHREIPPFRPDVRGQVKWVEPMSWPTTGSSCLVWDGSERSSDAEMPNHRQGLYYVGVSNETWIWDYSGNFGNVRTGQTVSIWFSGMAKTAPPHVYPSTLVIEPGIGMHFAVLGAMPLAVIVCLVAQYIRQKPTPVRRPEVSFQDEGSEEAHERLA